MTERIVLNLTFALTSFIFSCSALSSTKDVRAPSYKLNLDLAPAERWASIVSKFDAIDINNAMDHILEEVLLNSVITEVVLEIAAKVDEFYPPEYAEEMRGISKALNIDLGKIIVFNLVNEFAAHSRDTNDKNDALGCTSIVSVDKNSHIIHARNLDFSSTEFLKRVAMDVEFQRNGKTVYFGTTFAGMFGVLNSMKPGQFTMSFNLRREGSWWLNVLQALREKQSVVTMTREILEEVDNYDDAIMYLSGRRSIAPIYYIVGGIEPHEGALLVANRFGILEVDMMRCSHQHGWFVLQTNDDPWKPPKDDRRETGIKEMQKVGQANMDFDHIYSVLSVPPVYNNMTVYTCFMSAYYSTEYHTMIRYESWE